MRRREKLLPNHMQSGNCFVRTDMLEFINGVIPHAGLPAQRSGQPGRRKLYRIHKGFSPFRHAFPTVSEIDIHYKSEYNKLVS